MELDLFWIQDRQLSNTLPSIKIDGVLNPSEVMIKHLSRGDIVKNLKLIGHVEMEGRSDRIANLHSLGVARNSDPLDGLLAPDGKSCGDPDV